MLEALYYGLVSPQSATTKGIAETYFSGMNNTMANSSTIRSRRHSSPAASSPELEIDEPSVSHPPRKQSSLSPMPPAPVIEPQRLPSVTITDKSSWRLSFSSDNRASHLRKLSQVTNMPPPLNTEQLAGGSQSMSKWYHGQGLRPSLQSVACPENPPLECSPAQCPTCIPSGDVGGVDGGGDSAAALHLHEMGISQRLASGGIQSHSSPQLSSIGSRSHYRGVSSISAASRTTHKNRARQLQNTTDSLPLSERIPEAWGAVLDPDKIIQDGTSSFYPSANNSIQPSPKSSRFSLFSILAGSRSKTDLTESKWKSVLSLDHLPHIEPPPSTFLSPTSHQTSLSQSLIITPSASNISLPLPFVDCYRQPAVDNNSTTISETESFREREAELSVVRTRFAAAETSRISTTPRSSKFREEFDFDVTPIEPSSPSKPSAFSRLARFAARSFDGPFEKRMGTPITPMNPALESDGFPHHHRSKHAKGALNPVASPLEDNSVMGLWGNAVKLNGEPKAKDVASHFQIPVKGKQIARTKSHVSTQSKKKFALKGLGWGVGDKDSSSESEKEENSEDDWEKELANIAQKAKGRSKAVVAKPSKPDRRYPASWSKFPSHSRHERNSSAKADDRIQVQDFATDGSEFLNTGKKTLRERLQKRIVAQLDAKATTEVQNNTEGTFGRRSSMRPAGDLEFPELEVLPLQNVALMNQDEIAEHVEEVLKEEELDRKEEELDAIFGPVVKKAPPKPEIKPQVKMQGTRSRGLDRSNTVKVKDKASPVSTNDVTNKKPAAGPVSEAPAKKPPTRRGPVARKPGEQRPTSKPPPKIAPPVIMPSRGGANNAFAIMDGSMDHGDEDSVAALSGKSDTDEADISIADPRFYDDCIFNATPGPEKHGERDGSEDFDQISPKSKEGSRKYKYMTWSGKDRDKHGYLEMNRRSLGALMLRKSTDEMRTELKKAEIAEMENALRAAEKAWGGL